MIQRIDEIISAVHDNIIRQVELAKDRHCNNVVITDIVFKKDDNDYCVQVCSINYFRTDCKLIDCIGVALFVPFNDEDGFEIFDSSCCIKGFEKKGEVGAFKIYGLDTLSISHDALQVLGDCYLVDPFDELTISTWDSATGDSKSTTYDKVDEKIIFMHRNALRRERLAKSYKELHKAGSSKGQTVKPKNKPITKKTGKSWVKQTEDWKKNSVGYNWVKEQLNAGVNVDDIISTFNERHKTDPDNYSTRTGKPLSRAILSHWEGEMLINKPTVNKSIKKAIEWRQNSKGYQWAKEQILNGVDLETILTEFNRRHETDASFCGVDGNPIRIGTLQKWRIEITTHKYDPSPNKKH